MIEGADASVRRTSVLGNDSVGLNPVDCGVARGDRRALARRA